MNCLKCDKPMESQLQKMPSRVLVLITCKNPECEMKDYTFTTIGYDAETIKKYLADDE